MREAAKQFKKHYRRAAKLKEGGKAWEREITIAYRYKELAIKEYREELRKRYS